MSIEFAILASYIVREFVAEMRAMYPQCVALHIRVTKRRAAGVSPSRSLSKNRSVGFSAVVFRLPREMFQYLTFVDLVSFQGSGYGTWSYVPTPFPNGKL